MSYPSFSDSRSVGSNPKLQFLGSMVPVVDLLGEAVLDGGLGLGDEGESGRANFRQVLGDHVRDRVPLRLLLQLPVDPRALRSVENRCRFGIVVGERPIVEIGHVVHVAGHAIRIKLHVEHALGDDSAVELILPLLRETAGTDDETSLQVAAGDQLPDEKPRHDGLAGARVVGEQETKRLAGEQLVGDLAGRRLVRQLKRLGAVPLNADHRDEPVGQNAANCGVCLEILQLHALRRCFRHFQQFTTSPWRFGSVTMGQPFGGCTVTGTNVISNGPALRCGGSPATAPAQAFGRRMIAGSRSQDLGARARKSAWLAFPEE